MNKLFWFPDPADVACMLIPDPTGVVILGHPDTHSTGRKGISFAIPDDTPTSNGASLHAGGGYLPEQIRGILMLNGEDSFLRVDDVHYTKPAPVPTPVPPIPPQPPLPKDPFGIIKAVYAAGHSDLSTKAGCGTFTEDCVTALHATHSDKWGHIQKFPPQNHWPEQPYVPGGKVHAVDAIMLLVNTPDGTKAGIYDIVLSSESPEAQPAFNLKDAVNPTLWYYPAK
jgi:hypothetical protein